MYSRTLTHFTYYLILSALLTGCYFRSETKLIDYGDNLPTQLINKQLKSPNAGKLIITKNKINTSNIYDYFVTYINDKDEENSYIFNVKKMDHYWEQNYWLAEAKKAYKTDKYYYYLIFRTDDESPRSLTVLELDSLAAKDAANYSGVKIVAPDKPGAVDIYIGSKEQLLKFMEPVGKFYDQNSDKRDFQ